MDGGVASKLLLFTLTPQSIRLTAYCQLPRKRWRLLVRFTNSHVKPALKGEVDASVTSRRRGCIEAAVVYVNPSVNPPYGVLPAPRPGSLLVRHTNSGIKQTRGRLTVPIALQSLPFTRRQADFTWRSHISHCVSNISPCASRISPRA